MTKDELKQLYESEQEASSSVDRLHAGKDTFEGNLEYRAALLRFAKAHRAYEQAADSFIEEGTAS